MSTVYSDSIGNYFLGDCKFANHDINYPATIYPKFVGERVWYTDWWSDIISIFTAAGYTGISSTVPSSRTGAGNWQATPPGAFTEYFRYEMNGYNIVNIGISNKIIANSGYHFYENAAGSPGIDYAVCCNSSSFAHVSFTVTDNRTSTLYSSARFLYMGKLSNVNPNFSFYTASPINSCILLYLYMGSGLSFSSASLTSIGSGGTQKSHYISSAQKTLLETGDAIYPIACSGGSPTPTGQWATDMYVFDNNATLGYPAIGKVPNLLLGVGTYTYLKPVRLITAPDAGSNLWLPVGTWGGNRTLLMRCYATP